MDLKAEPQQRWWGLPLGEELVELRPLCVWTQAPKEPCLLRWVLPSSGVGAACLAPCSPRSSK